ncbi:MAG: C13 family peptidase [Candidatus Hodarchaeota archaeon]
MVLSNKKVVVLSLAIVCIGVLVGINTSKYFCTITPIERSNAKGTTYWSLIVAASAGQRFTHDAYTMYNTLIDHYDFSHNKIYFLAPDASTWEGELPYNNNGNNPSPRVPVPRDCKTSISNIECVINQIAAHADADDIVVIWWTGHGNIGRFMVNSGYIMASQFDAMLDKIVCKAMYLFLGACYSGSFIEHLNDEQNRVIYTSSRSNEKSHRAGDVYSFWPRATYRALDPDFYAITADNNRNGRISLWEIYEYAYTSTTEKFDDQTPQRWIGQDIGIGAYPDADDYIGDGYYMI